MLMGWLFCSSLWWLFYNSYLRFPLVSVRENRKFVVPSLTVLSRTGRICLKNCWHPCLSVNFWTALQDFTLVNLLSSTTVVMSPSLWLFGATRGLLFHYVRKGNAILIMAISFMDITASEEPEPHQGWLFLLSSHNLFGDISFHLRECFIIIIYLGVDFLC